MEEGKKKIIWWHGFWKELPWFIFVVIIIFAAWAYRRDVGACTDILLNKTARCDINICGPSVNPDKIETTYPEFNTSLADEVFQPNG